MNEFFAKMVTDAVKANIKHNIETAYNAEDRKFWERFAGLKLIEISRADDKTMHHCGCEHTHVIGEYGGHPRDGKELHDTYMKLEAKFRFKAKKYENDTLFYEVVLYSDGSISTYYDGDRCEF